MQAYRALEPDSDEPVQFCAVSVWRWRAEWGDPKLLFREMTDAEALAFARQLPEVKALVEACSLAPLATIAHQMDKAGGGGDSIRRIIDALVLFKEATQAQS